MEENLFISSYNKSSKMHAVLSDDGKVAFLYLHAPSDEPAKTQDVLADVLAYNRIELIDVKDVQAYSPEPPPIAKRYGNNKAVIKNPENDSWDFSWSESGDRVLLRRNGEPWCLVSNQETKGYSKAIKVNSPWGAPWDKDLALEIG